MPDSPALVPWDAWPTLSQERLLRAALAERAVALDEWTRWTRLYTLDAADAASTRLFPLVYEHLWRDAPDMPEAARLKGLYRHTWVRNQLHARLMADVIEALSAAAIPTLVVKGLALQIVAYGGSGARAMEDGDVVVPRELAVDAAGLLERRGWRAVFPPLSREMRCRASSPFEHVRGGSFDLHWHILYDDMRPGADDESWAGAQPLELLHASTLTLQPADHLLHALTHGLAWAPVAPIRWVADVVGLVRATGPALDWRRFWRRVAAHRVDWIVAQGLTYVERLLPGVLPAPAVAHARAVRPSLGDRIDFACRMRGRSFAPGYLPRFWRHFRRALPAARYGRGPIGFVRYCADTARVERSWRTPWLLAREWGSRRQQGAMGN